MIVTTISRPSASTVVVTDPSGRTLRFAFVDNRLQTVTDANVAPSRVVTFRYDAAGDLKEVVDVTGATTSFTYDGSHRMLTMRSPRHFGDTTTTPSPVVTNRYDAAGRVDRQTDELGRATTFTYGPPGESAESTLVTDPKGNATLYRFEYGMLSSEVRGYGRADEATWIHSYDPNSLGCTSIIDANGNLSTATYDGRGNRLTATDNASRTTVWDYNDLNQLESVRDAASVMTTYTYDGTWGTNAGNLKSVSRPLLNATGQEVARQTTTFNYLEDGNTNRGDITSMVGPNGKRWKYGYDARGYRNRETDPLLNVTTSVYDGGGRMLSAVSPRGNAAGRNPLDYTTTFSYEADNSLKTVTNPLGKVAERHYDLNRNLDWELDADQRKTLYRYDAASQLTEVTRGDGTATAATERTEYWPDGSVRYQYDSANKATTYEYDPRGRLKTITDPLGRTTSLGYDRLGNVVSEADPGGNCSTTPTLSCTTFTYDVVSQLKAVDHSDPATPDIANTTYDPVGRRLSMQDGTGTSSWTWDSLGRLTSSTNGAGIAGGGQQVTYGYQLGGEMTRITYPGNLTVTRQFDDAGRMDWLEDWQLNRTTFAYDQDGNWTTKSLPTGSGVSETRAYDRAGRLVDIKAQKGATTLGQFAYGRTDAGLLSSVDSTGVVDDDRTYGHDANQRLCLASPTPGTCAAPPAGSTRFSYDTADNLSGIGSTTQAFDPAHQLCWAGTGTGTCASPPGGATQFGYDTRGNRTSTAPSSGPASTFGYDQANRLTTATAPASGSVAAGDHHSLASSPQGEVWVWGANGSGQLGTGNTAQVNTPLKLASLSGVRAVSAGSAHSMALKSDGTVWAWGSNTDGQLGIGNQAQMASPTQVPGLSSVVAVSAGDFHSLVLKEDGTVWAWGRNSSGQLGIGNQTAQPSPVQVPGIVAGAVSGGGSHSLALRADGTVLGWGANAQGQIGDATTKNRPSPVAVGGLTDVKAIAAGTNHSMALRADGTIRTWGHNGFGQLGINSTKNSRTPVAVSGLSGVTAIAARDHSIALLQDGTARAWGYNLNGQVGNGSTTNRTTPAPVTGLSGASAVGAGRSHSLALNNDGSGRSWGLNSSGQLGRGNTTSSTTPVAVSMTAFKVVATTAFSYNGDGLRMAKAAGGATTAFAWDVASGLPLLLSETSGASTTRYIYGPGGLPLARVGANSQVSYYHQDQLGSTRLITGATGAVQASKTYDPYGRAASSVGSVAQPFGFAGEYTDAETGFVYLRARYYDPGTGQFLTRDPIEAVTREPYGYVGGNPLNRVDPLGLAPWDWVAEKADDAWDKAYEETTDFADDAWDSTGGRGVSYVNDHKVGIMQSGSVVLGVGAIVVTGGTASFLLAGGSALLAVGAEAADPKPCRGQRIAQTAALAGVGLVGGVLWKGASQAADMASDAASARYADNIGRAFGVGDLMTNVLPDPCSC